jgi:ERCC4-type nuclease
VNSTKSPESGVGSVSEPRLMSQVERVREVVCAYIIVIVQSEWCICTSIRPFT